MNKFDFVNWFEDVRYGTRRLISMVPDEAFDFRANPDSPSMEKLMRAFGSLEEQFVKGICKSDWTDARNPTDARRQMEAAFAEDTDELEGFCDLEYDTESLETVDDILDHLDMVHQEALDIIAQVDENNFSKRVVQVPWGEEATIERFLVGMVEREIHHRAELAFSLRLYGVPVTNQVIFGP
jgi:hypothetical protein